MKNIRENIQKLTRPIGSVGKFVGKNIFPAILAIIGTFFVTTHLKPNLNVFVADGEVMTFQLKDAPNKYRIVLIDWLDNRGPRIVSATDITFKSAKDVRWKPDHSPREWISKFVIDNDGWVTANHIIIGIGIPKGAESLNVIPSPNITILSDNLVKTSANYPPYRKIEIERLGKSEKAVLTVLSSCGCASPVHAADSNLFIAADKSGNGYSPVLFLSSQEGMGQIQDSIGIKDAFSIEKDLFPSSTSGFWATGFDVAKNSEPTLDPVDHMNLTLGVDDNDGKEQPVSLNYP